MTTNRWRAWAKGGVAPRWYLLVVPIAALGFTFGDRRGFLEAPLWVPGSLLVTAVALRMAAFSRWGRDCSQRQLHARAALQAAGVTAVIYSTGFGPMLALGYMIVAQEGIWASGSRAAMPGVVWTVAGLVAGEVGIALDWAPTAVSDTIAHTIAGLAGVGSIFGIYLMQETAAEREEANESERRARQHLAAILEQVPDALVVVDREGRLRFVSRMADQIFGDQPGDLVGTTGLDRVHPDDRAHVEAFFARLVDSPSATDTIEHRVRGADGECRWVHVTARNLFHLHEVDAIVATVRDVTERKRFEDERAALDRAREDFLAIAAHELRTPLTTLAGAAKFVVTSPGTSDEERQEALELIGRQGRRLEELLAKLLDLSALVAGGTPVGRDDVEVASVVDEAVRSLVPPPGADVTVNVPPDLRVLADRVRLEQVVVNLLGNAYSYGGPHVCIDAAVDGERVVLRVTDDGPGVEEDLVARLFEPFIRGHDGTTGTGAGLGLAICWRLIEAMDGDLRYQSGPDGGASFSVSLPASRRTSPSAPSTKSVNPSPTAHN